MIAVVGIGADGWAGLGAAARAAVTSATIVIGSERQLALLPADQVTADRRPLPAPLDPLLDELAADGHGVCVLASGDPMLHGIGATLARRVGPERLDVHVHPSAHALACARLGWPAAEVELVSAVARAPEVVARVLQPGRRAVAYVTGADADDDDPGRGGACGRHVRTLAERRPGAAHVPASSRSPSYCR